MLVFTKVPSQIFRALSFLQNSVPKGSWVHRPCSESPLFFPHELSCVYLMDVSPGGPFFPHTGFYFLLEWALLLG